jgi:hypothetical protein
MLDEAFPKVPAKDLLLVGRIVVDMIYAGVELLFDAPLNPRDVANVIAAMVASHLVRLHRENAS